MGNMIGMLLAIAAALIGLLGVRWVLKAVRDESDFTRDIRLIAAALPPQDANWDHIQEWLDGEFSNPPPGLIGELGASLPVYAPHVMH